MWCLFHVRHLGCFGPYPTSSLVGVHSGNTWIPCEQPTPWVVQSPAGTKTSSPAAAPCPLLGAVGLCVFCFAHEASPFILHLILFSICWRAARDLVEQWGGTSCICPMAAPLPQCQDAQHWKKITALGRPIRAAAFPEWALAHPHTTEQKPEWLPGVWVSNLALWGAAGCFCSPSEAWESSRYGAESLRPSAGYVMDMPSHLWLLPFPWVAQKLGFWRMGAAQDPRRSWAWS